MQLASDFMSSFDKLIGAYVRIAENLPRFDRLSVTFQGTSDFQQVLAMVYSDILEFHRRAYKFFRRRGKNGSFDDSKFHAKMTFLQAGHASSTLPGPNLIADFLGFSKTLQSIAILWTRRRMHFISLKQQR